MKLNYKKTVFVGFAFFLISAFWQAYDTIIPKILTDKFGMSQSLSGVIMAADNVLALFLLPLFGYALGQVQEQARPPHALHNRGHRSAPRCSSSCSALPTICSCARSRPSPSTTPRRRRTLWDADLTAATPDGVEFEVQEEFTREQFAAIEMTESGRQRQPRLHQLRRARPPGLRRRGHGRQPRPAHLLRRRAAPGAREHGHLPQPRPSRSCRT